MRLPGSLPTQLLRCFCARVGWRCARHRALSAIWFNEMAILITGAGGFVGKRLVASLAAAGRSVVAIVRTEPSAEDRHYFAGRLVKTIKADLSNLDTSHLPAGIYAVVALAQSAHFREFPERAKEVFDVNVTANLKLLDWSVRSGVKRFVLASSGGIYGGKFGAQFQETNDFPVNSPPLVFILEASFALKSCSRTIGSFLIVRSLSAPSLFMARINVRICLSLGSLIQCEMAGRSLFKAPKA